MSWDNIDLSAVADPNATLTEGEKYIFELRSAKASPFKEGRIDFVTRVASGPHAGKVVYGSFPPPPETPDPSDKFYWVLGAMKRFQKAIGVPQEDGEDMIAYFNRAAGSTFKSSVQNRMKTKDGIEEAVSEVKIGSITKG